MNKKLKIFETFAGYGSQAIALKNIGIEIDEENSFISEWTTDAIIAYASIHQPKWLEQTIGDFDYLSKEDMIKYLLANYTLSTEKKKVEGSYIPIDEKSYMRMKEDYIRTLLASVKISNNLGSIMDVKGEQVKGMDLLTYSFPCQDLSIAGKGAGIKEGTRSGLLFQIERILEEQSFEDRPQILLMENVKNLVGKNNKESFEVWIEKLKDLGYMNSWQVLNAKDYGVPQNRERVFMVSTKRKVGQTYSVDATGYTFPPKQELNLRLKDFLEDNVDESYYLSDEHIAKILDFNKTEEILNNKKLILGINPTSQTYKSDNIVHGENWIISTLRAGNGLQLVAIATSVYKNYFYIQPQANGEPYAGDGLSNRIWKTDNHIGTIDTGGKKILESIIPFRIRKITEREALRLMGLNDTHITNLFKHITTKSARYKLAGNSIVVPVLEAIFKEMYNV